MCGVAGYLSQYDHGNNKMKLKNLRDDLAHRGPDGSGIFISDKYNVALVHTRLAIIDLSTSANQPMRSFNSKIVLSFNGEIYNYRELRNELKKDGVEFRSSSDTEVILELYKKNIEKQTTLRKFF